MVEDRWLHHRQDQPEEGEELTQEGEELVEQEAGSVQEGVELRGQGIKVLKQHQVLEKGKGLHLK